MPFLVLIEGIGSGRSSRDSRWRRCIFVNASRKSDRSFLGAFLPDLFSVTYQFFLYLSYFSEDGQWEWFSCANLSISMHFSSVQPILSYESRCVAMMRHGLLQATFKRCSWWPCNPSHVPAWCRHLEATHALATWTRTCRGSPSLPKSRLASARVAACPALARDALSRPMPAPACTIVPRWR